MEINIINEFIGSSPEKIGTNCWKWITENQSLDIYNQIKVLLLKHNCSLLQSDELGKNKFATYLIDNQTISITFFTECKRLIIVLDLLEFKQLPPLKPSNINNVCKPKLSMITLKNGNSFLGAGMSFVLTLSSGNFIIIDGGYNFNAAGLYSFLLKNTPKNQKPIITAWILSHGHEDHVGCVFAFCEQYANDIIVKSIVANPYRSKTTVDPLKDLLTEETTTSLSNQFGASWLCPHLGQVFYFDNCAIQFLHTQDETTENCDWLNKTSLSFMVTIKDQRIFFPTDFEDDSFAQLYGEDLKCDILQVTHHGCSGGTQEEYDYMKPKVAFFPIGKPFLEERLAPDYPRAANYYLINSVEKYFSDSGQTITLDL